MGWRILVFYLEPDFDMSKSTNTVVYFNWKTVIYIYVCRQCRAQFMLLNSSMYIYDGKVSHMHRRMCYNEIIPNR